MTGRHSPDPAATAERLLVLLREQRETLAKSDLQALTELESGTARIGEALSELAALTGTGIPRLDAAVLQQLQRELQANQAMLAGLGSANRRARDVLFGESSLYTR